MKVIKSTSDALLIYLKKAKRICIFRRYSLRFGKNDIRPDFAMPETN